jgi:hypothetical protein
LTVFCENTKEKLRILKEKFELENEEFDPRVSNFEFYQNETLNNFNEMNNESISIKYPFTFPNLLNLIVLNDTQQNFNDLNNQFNELIQLNNNNGRVFISNNLIMNYIINDFSKYLLSKIHEKFIVTLKCGHLEQFNISILPTPKKFKGLKLLNFNIIK